jgi:hypothetical protein
LKHIFSIHSPITYFCAANVVLHEQLNREDVIFIYTSFIPPDTLGIAVPSFYTQHSSLLKKLMTFNLVKAYDNYISNITNGEEFNAYIDLAHYYQKILVTHTLCQGFHFIEEGTASYLTPSNLGDLTRIESSTSFRFAGLQEKTRAIFRIMRGYNLKLLAIPYFANAFAFSVKSKFYGFDASVYPGVLQKKKIVLKPRSVTWFHSNDKDENIDISDALILIEESYFKVYGIKKKIMQDCMDRTWSIIEKEIEHRKIFIKLRPGQNETNSWWPDFLKKRGVPYEILRHQVVLEALLVEARNCKVIGTISSLLFYAAIFGHEAHSNYALLEEKPAAVFDELDFYWEKVNQIESH